MTTDRPETMAALIPSQAAMPGRKAAILAAHPVGRAGLRRHAA